MSASKKCRDLKVYDRNGTRIRRGDLIQCIHRPPITWDDEDVRSLSSPAIVVGFSGDNHYMHLVCVIGKDGFMTVQKADVEVLKKCFK